MVENDNQIGFGVFEVIAVIAITAIVGLMGWLAYSNIVLKPTPAAYLSAPSSQTQKPNMGQSVENTIKIPELGISLVVADSLKDLTYTYSATNQPTKVGGKNIIVGTAKFSTKALADKYPDCSSAGTAPPLGSVTKVTGEYSTDVLGPTWSGGGVVKQFPDSFLTFAGPQSSCFGSTGETNSAISKNTVMELKTLSETLKGAKEI